MSTSPANEHTGCAYGRRASLAGVAGALSAQTTKFVSLGVLSVNTSVDVLVMLVLGRHRAAKIDHGQQHEDEGQREQQKTKKPQQKPDHDKSNMQRLPRIRLARQDEPFNRCSATSRALPLLCRPAFR